jgi:uncharacterized RDD family membrane protein YckC
VRAFARLMFAADPDQPQRYRAPRPPQIAEPRARLAAAGIDVTLAVVALIWSGAIGGDRAFGVHASALRLMVRVLAWVAVFIVPALMETAGGQTFGKRLVGIRVVDETSGGPIPLRVALHRDAARALFWFIAFTALGEPLVQALHDRSAGTVVIRAAAYGWVPGVPGLS